MTDIERTYWQLCFAVWGMGMEIALQRLGMASVIMGGNGEQSAFAPFLSHPSEAQRPTVH